jgi:hypothetical protein
MRLSAITFIAAFAALAVTGCTADAATIPDAQDDTSTGEVTPDVAPDTAAPDVEPDTTPDVAPDITDTTDTSPDVAPDADTTADVEPTDVADTLDVSTDDTGDTGDTSSNPTTCGTGEDCTWCVFATAPQTVADCTCPICPTTAMTRDQCDANHAAWNAVCSGPAWHDTASCPVPRCLAMPELICNASTSTCEACDTDACPILTCKVSEQVTAPGECCPKCTGTNACTEAADCGLCTYGSTVTGPDDCFCPICPSHPLSTAQCELNTTAWNTHCTAWYEETTCPMPICMPTAAATCNEGGQCMRDPNACFDGGDCTTCRFGTAPRAPSQCACPGCPVPTSLTHCEAIEEAVSEHCPDFDFEACPVPPCARPPALGCRSDYTCGYGDLLPQPE